MECVQFLKKFDPFKITYKSPLYVTYLSQIQSTSDVITLWIISEIKVYLTMMDEAMDHPLERLAQCA